MVFSCLPSSTRIDVDARSSSFFSIADHAGLDSELGCSRAELQPVSLRERLRHSALTYICRPKYVSFWRIRLDCKNSVRNRAPTSPGDRKNLPALGLRPCGHGAAIRPSRRGVDRTVYPPVPANSLQVWIRENKNAVNPQAWRVYGRTMNPASPLFTRFFLVAGRGRL